MKFTLYSNSYRGRADKTLYPYKHEITDVESLKEAVSHDYVGASYKDNYRNEANFESCDVIVVDLDNDHSENSEDWKTLEDIKNAFPDVSFAYQYSRNHNKIKDGKPARPKIHLLFPCAPVASAEECKYFKQLIYLYFPFIDTNAMDSARCLCGTEDPQVGIVEGKMNIDEFFNEENFENNIGKVKKGSRNKTMSVVAAKIYKRMGITDEATESIYKYNEEHMVPPLDREELDATVIPSAQKFFRTKVMADPNYKPADEYEEADWVKKLARNKNGAIVNSLLNLVAIMQHDESLQHIVYNELSDSLEIVGEVPWDHPGKQWRDADDSQVICYVENTYHVHFSKEVYMTALQKVADDRKYHPIKNYFDGLPKWDGVKRVDTLLIDYFGADDNEYVRAVIRKMLAGAYRRVMEPGIKFDNILCLNTKQGTGKSTLIAKLGGEWYNDSLAISDMDDKTAAEKLQGYWILEIGELAGMKRADIDKVKAFVSRQNDRYRPAFGRRVTAHLRQCIFFATTNSENGFLRDTTGNRRFWVVKASGEGTKKAWDLTQAEVDQIWAEVKTYAKEEQLFLSYKLEELATYEQSQAMEIDEREGMIKKYLDTLVPADWDSMDLAERRAFISGDEFITKARVGTVKRNQISNMEIWCECLGKDQNSLKRSDSLELVAIMVRNTEWVRTESTHDYPLYGRQKIYKRKTK